MKSFLKSLIASVATIAALASCNRAEVDNVVSNDSLVHFTLNAKKIETKTAIMDMGEGAWQPLWQSTDKMGVLSSIPSVTGTSQDLVAEATFDPAIVDDGLTATFSGTINLADNLNKTLYGFVPATALKKVYQNGYVGLDVPSEQNPTMIGADLFMLPGDVLISQPVSYYINGNEGIANEDLYFKRLTSTVKLNLKFPSTAPCFGDKILKVTMESAKANIAGRISVSPVAGVVKGVNNYGSTPKVVSTEIGVLNKTAAASVPVFFSVAPVEMKASDGTIIFTIETETYSISKQVTGKSIAFESGEIYAIGLDLTPSPSCVYTSKSGDDPQDEHEVTPGRFVVELNKGFYNIANAGSVSDEQSAWSAEGLKIVSGCTENAQNKTYYDAKHIRYYTDSYLKLSVPSGYEIIKVVFTPDGKWDGGVSTGENGEYSEEDKIWTGRNSSVDFSFTKQCRVASIKVTVVKEGEQAQPSTASFAIDPTEMEIAVGGNADATISTDYDGKLLTSSNNSNVSASVSGTTLTISVSSSASVGETAVITVYGTQTDDYYPVSATVNVTVKAAPTTPKTVTYTITSTSAVTVQGGFSGATASYSSTYETKCQLTKGNTMTLTLSGFDGKKIAGLKLSMKSNASAGAGYLSFTAGSTSLASIGTATNGVKFNNAMWHGSYSTSYVDVTPSMSVANHVVAQNEILIVTIGATTNSLYCQSIEISYFD